MSRIPVDDVQYTQGSYVAKLSLGKGLMDFARRQERQSRLERPMYARIINAKQMYKRGRIDGVTLKM